MYILASAPNLQFFSSATRSATDVAAIRLGYYCNECQAAIDVQLCRFHT